MNKYNKYQVALDTLYRIANEFNVNAELDKNLLQDLVNKAIRKKPALVHEYSSDVWCPNCHSFDIEMRGFEGGWEKLKYCPECGQRIDWTEDEQTNSSD